MSELAPAEFVKRRLALKSHEEKEALLKAAIDTENVYRGLFARHRESWEIPEVDDPYVGLVDVYGNLEAFRCLPQYETDKAPRCFELGEKRLPEGKLSVAESMKEFEDSWDCFTEAQLRFLDWNNVFAAGGSVAGCLGPLPDKVKGKSWADGRSKRRAYFHDEAFPGSDVDLFLYGLTPEQAEKKLVDIYEAVQAANPYKVMCFRSAHAITLVSQYPFRHVQVVLRLYNSPAEVLMGFDVDSCACGYDGKRAYTCQRTVFAFAAQENTIDMSRRSPSYEMRLSKYALRGFSVVVPELTRDRVDPSLYERRFDKVQGLARLLLLERLATPEARFRYRIEQKLKRAARREQYALRRQLNKVLRDKHELARMEDSLVPVEGAAGAELSNYSTVFLPWGSAWTAEKVKRLMSRKDHALNTVEFLPGGRVGKCTRKYKVHVCAVGTMPEVIEDCWPSDPPIPADVPQQSLDQCVHGRVKWLADNPGRQQIGSFHPITEGDWMEGAYLSSVMEGLPALCAKDDSEAIAALFQGDAAGEQLGLRDYLGRSALHVAVLCNAEAAIKVLLARPELTAEHLDARLADGRTVFHLAAMHGFNGVLKQLLEKRKKLLAKAEDDEGDEDEDEDEAPEPAAASGIPEMDLDCADWELKLSPLQYSVVLGGKETLEVLLAEGASAKKVAVHKEKSMSRSTLSLCASYVTELKEPEQAAGLVQRLFESGASSAQVDGTSSTIWHELVKVPQHTKALEVFLQADPNRAKTLDVVNSQGETPLSTAVSLGNEKAVKLLLDNGASAELSLEEYSLRKKRAKEAAGGNSGSNYMFRNNPGGESRFRAPIVRAALEKQVGCLKIFLEHNPALVSTEVKENQEKSKTILDIVLGHRKTSEKSQEDRKKADEKVEKELATLRKGLEGEKEGTYTHSVWQFLVWRAEYEKEKKRIEEEYEQNCGSLFGNNNDDPEEEAKEAEELIKIVESYGGKKHPSQDEKEEEDNRFRGFRYFRHGNQISTDPTNDYGALPENQQNYRHFHMFTRLPKVKMAVAQELFDAAWRGDAAAVQAAGQHVTMSTVNALGNTPLWYAVSKGDVECAKAIFKVAEEQFLRTKKVDEEKADPTDIAGQLKRINNLDIAAGSMPKEAGKSPEEIRRKLEALEETVVVGSEKTIVEDVTTKVPAHVLLLKPNFYKLEQGSTVWKFIDRLFALSPNDWVDKKSEEILKLGTAIGLTPLELAIMQGDAPMVEALLALAKRCAKESKDEEEETPAPVIDEDDDDTEGSEEDSDVDETPQNNAGQKSLRELTYNLVCNTNHDLLGFDAIDLAVASDNVSIFRAVLSFAQEFGLPTAAAREWQYEADPNPEKSRERMPSFYHRERKPMLHMALALNASNIAKMVLKGEADGVLVGCLEAAAKGSGDLGKGKPPRRTEAMNLMDFTRAAKNCIALQIREGSATREKLVQRFVGPTALDAEGRPALFYATPETLPVLLETGSVDLEVAARKPGNKKKSDVGYTALMAAAQGGRYAQAEALIKAGSKLTATGGSTHWNSLHYAVQCAMSSQFGHSCHFEIEEERKKAEQARHQRLVELFLSSCKSPEEEKELLFAPKSEHTPFMLAAKHGVAAPLVKMLAERMVAAGAEAGKAALARKDPQLLTALHFAAGNSSPEPEIVKSLIDVAGLKPNVENAAGATPLELLMEKVAEVWKEQQARRAQKKGKKGKKREPEEVEYKERRCLELLQEAAGCGRETASFEAVRQAATKSASQAGQKEEPEDQAAGVGAVMTQHKENLANRHWNFPRVQD